MFPATRLAIVAALALAAAPAALATQHSGDVSGTWTAAGSPHLVVADCRVPAGQQLVIEAGAAVLFDVATGLVVDGRLDVEGNPAAPVMLRSETPGPRPGEWEGVVLSGAGDHVIRHAIIDNAVVGIDVRANAHAIVDATVVSLSERDGLLFRAGSTGDVTGSLLSGNGGAGIATDDASPTIAGCAFSANDVPLRTAGASFPELTDLSAAFNVRHDGIDVDASRPVTGAGIWMGGGLPRVVSSGTLVLEPASLVVMRAGSILKMGDTARLSVSGALGAAGTADEPCAITSLADDTTGGDTNGNGSLTWPAKGSWNGIDVADGGVVSLVETRLAYADDGLRVQPGGTLALRRCDLGRCLNRGVAFGASTRGLVEDSTLHDNDVALFVTDQDGIDVGRPSPDGPLVGGGNAFTCNAWVDVEYAGSTPLPAHGNFWSAHDPAFGSVLGPVDTDPWLPLEPNGPASERVLRVARASAGFLHLTWPEMGTCLEYLVEAAALPEGPFGALADATTAESVTVPDTLSGARDVVYYRITPRVGPLGEDGAP